MKKLREVFCLTDFETFLSDLSLEETEKLFDGIEVSIEKDDELKIKELAFKKVGLKKSPSKRTVAFRFFAAAACLCIVAVGAFFSVKTFSKPKPEASTSPSVSTSASSSGEKALMLAITNGDESLIEKLLKSGVLASREILNYAVNCTSFLSYGVISDIAKSVEDVFGSTGLDPLLESTLIGNSKKALEELKKKDGMLMTPTEKLAFFFSVAFCDSDVVEAFKEKGADIFSTDAAGNNILQIAEKYGNTKNAKYAKEQGIK